MTDPTDGSRVSCEDGGHVGDRHHTFTWIQAERPVAPIAIIVAIGLFEAKIASLLIVHGIVALSHPFGVKRLHPMMNEMRVRVFSPLASRLAIGTADQSDFTIRIRHVKNQQTSGLAFHALADFDVANRFEKICFFIEFLSGKSDLRYLLFCYYFCKADWINF